MDASQLTNKEGLLEAVKNAVAKGVKLYINSVGEWLYGPSDGFLEAKLDQLEELLLGKEVPNNNKKQTSTNK